MQPWSLAVRKVDGSKKVEEAALYDFGPGAQSPLQAASGPLHWCGHFLGISLLHRKEPPACANWSEAAMSSWRHSRSITEGSRVKDWLMKCSLLTKQPTCIDSQVADTFPSAFQMQSARQQLYLV